MYRILEYDSQVSCRLLFMYHIAYIAMLACMQLPALVAICTQMFVPCAIKYKN